MSDRADHQRRAAGRHSDQIAGSEIGDSPLTVANTGSNPLQAVVTTVASPIQPLPASGDGFTIGRTYYNSTAPKPMSLR